jgi:hypothetical protein
MKMQSITLVLSITCAAYAAPEFGAFEQRKPAPPPAPGIPALPQIAPVPVAPMQLAQAPAAAPHVPFKGDVFSSRSRGGRTLIIQSSDPDPKTYANLEEDLSVMYRILSKPRKQDDGSFKLEAFLGGSSSSTVKSMYIEGYGAMFMLNVRFPLAAPQVSEEQPKPKDPTSEEWERVKRELYSRNSFEIDVDHIYRSALGPQTEEYDAHKVEEFTAEILEALKNATNIRNLKSDEFVTVAVLGAESGTVRTVVEKDDSDEDGKPKRKTRIESASGGKVRGESTMTIRAKKSDVDDFAKGKLNLDAFRKKTKILVYLRPLDAQGKVSVFTPSGNRF